MDNVIVFTFSTCNSRCYYMKKIIDYLKLNGMVCKVYISRNSIELSNGQILKFLVEQFRPRWGDNNLRGYKEEQIYHYMHDEKNIIEILNKRGVIK